jgi:hypothetical protein
MIKEESESREKLINDLLKFVLFFLIELSLKALEWKEGGSDETANTPKWRAKKFPSSYVLEHTRPEQI